MKFRTIEIGNIELDIRVKNTVRGVLLEAFEPDHKRRMTRGTLLKSVKVTESDNPLKDFEKAYDELETWLNENAADHIYHINPQRSKRGYFDAICHICNYG